MASALQRLQHHQFDFAYESEETPSTVEDDVDDTPVDPFDHLYMDVNVEVKDSYTTLAWRVQNPNDEKKHKAGGYVPRIVYERALKLSRWGLFT